jgi:hypothetical protein
MDIKPSALLPPVAAEICVLDDGLSMPRAIDRLLVRRIGGSVVRRSTFSGMPSAILWLWQ